MKKMTKPMYHGAWDPLWAASEELGMPVSFHALGLELRAPDPEDEAEYRTRYTTGMSTVHSHLSLISTLFLLFPFSSVLSARSISNLAVVPVGGLCSGTAGFKFVARAQCGHWVDPLTCRSWGWIWGRN